MFGGVSEGRIRVGVKVKVVETAMVVRGRRRRGDAVPVHPATESALGAERAHPTPITLEPKLTDSLLNQSIIKLSAKLDPSKVSEGDLWP